MLEGMLVATSLAIFGHSTWSRSPTLSSWSLLTNPSRNADLSCTNQRLHISMIMESSVITSFLIYG